jgi:hypothetical protein
MSIGKDVHSSPADLARGNQMLPFA